MALPAIAAAAAPIPTVPTLPSTGQIGWTGGTGPAAGAPETGAAASGGVPGAESFGQTMARAVESLQGAQAAADRLAVSAATGDLTNVHDYMIAATEAALATELTVAVRNKAVESFNAIMNMPV